jgi:hypothetical protein
MQRKDRSHEARLLTHASDSHETLKLAGVGRSFPAHSQALPGHEDRVRKGSRKSSGRSGPHTEATLVERVQVPFWFFDPEKLELKLNLFDEGAALWRAATGEDPPPPEPPHDPFTSWVALAYVGGIEENGPGLGSELDREARLRVAADALTEDQLLVVETIAVPKRYRKLNAHALENLVRSAESYVDRLWAACWLTLTGWTESTHCSLEDVCAERPMGELDEAVRSAFAREHGVASDQDVIGTARIGRSYDASLIDLRISICQAHYALNGPPPYEYVKDTITPGPGWTLVARLVPDGS